MNIIIAGGINLIDPKLGLIFWTLVTFLVVVLILRFSAWGPIIKALDERDAKITGDIDKAANDRTESEKLLEEAKIALKKQLSASEEILSDSKTKAEKQRDVILAKAVTEAEEVKNRALKEIEMAKTKAVSEIQNHVLKLSVSIAGKILEKELDENAQKSLVEKSLASYKN